MRRWNEIRKRMKKTVIFGAAAAMAVEALFMVNCGVEAEASSVDAASDRDLEGSGTAEESDEGLLIEDFGEEMADNSGADLNELKDAERRESERAAEAEAIARAREKAMQEGKLWLEAADPEILQQHLDILTETDSPTGSDGELICAGYIEQVMEQYGFTISEQNFHEGFLNEDGVDAPGMNVIAERGADAEERTNDIFIIATHYDSKTKPSEDDPFANDKTGTAVLLEMARILSYVDTDSDICFVFFSGEEDGLYGSSEFVEFMQEDYAHRVAGVLYVERVGYAADDVYLLKTLDGKENSVGNLVKESELASLLLQPEGAEEAFGQELSGMETEQDEDSESTGKNWIWTSDQETGQYHFAMAGMEAVTVSQDVFGEYRVFLDQDTGGHTAAEKKMQETELEQGSDGVEKIEMENVEPENIEVDIDRLAAITDILAACVGQVMK